MPSNLYSIVANLVYILETSRAKSVQSVLAVTALASLLVVLVTAKSLSWSNQKNPHDAPFIRGLPFVGSWQFLTRQHDFVIRGLDHLGNVFRFKLLNHDVFVVSGEAWRKEFLARKDFALREGYCILAGGVQEPAETEPANKKRKTTENMAWLSKRIIAILHKDRLAKVLPQVCEDVDRLMHKWGGRGTFYPFEDIYNMVFQLTARISICREIADDPVEVAKLTRLFWDFNKSSTASGVLLLWLPQKARRIRTETIVALYQMILMHVSDRQDTGRREEDSMQVLIDAGDSAREIVEFSLKVLFAGVVNTAVMASWIPYFLAVNTRWKLKAVTEVKSVLSKHSPTSNPSLLSKLSAVPPDAWEEEMPVLDLCLRETIRLVGIGTVLMRRNMGPAVHVQGKQVDSGGFLVYPPTEIHHNSDLYPEPFEYGLFDPGRYARGDGRTQASGFVGWGAGRHPCLGKRLAKLEVKVIMAMLLSRYEFELVDVHGNSVTKVPEPDRNNLIQATPIGDKVYIKYKRVAV